VVDRELIAQTDLFADLTDDELESIVASATRRDLRRGDVLFSEGDDSSDFYVVAEGRIAIARRSIDGRESVMALMERGDVIGEMSLFDSNGRSAEARALEHSAVIVIGNEPVRALYQARPTLLWRVVEMLVTRLRDTNAGLADSVFLDVTGRTAKRLLEMAGENDEFTLPVTQEELAGMVGASRERVNKAIASFVRLGWIDQRDRRYKIVDRDQLTLRSS
jgi:CRP/FNR family cyclic AMP-dependent transcriptional regulator